MTTAIILIVMLGGGAVWLYRLGRKSSNADRLESTHEVLGNINEFNRKEDESKAEGLYPKRCLSHMRCGYLVQILAHQKMR